MENLETFLQKQMKSLRDQADVVDGLWTIPAGLVYSALQNTAKSYYNKAIRHAKSNSKMYELGRQESLKQVDNKK